jgi:hypothetical protein
MFKALKILKMLKILKILKILKMLKALKMLKIPHPFTGDARITNPRERRWVGC